MQRAILVLLSIFSISLLVGCGADTGGRVALSGTVTLNDAPLKSGTIKFESVDGSAMSGATITNGKYEIPAQKGLQPGKYTVRVTAVEEGASAGEAPGDSMAAETQNKDLIPEEFNAKSNVTMEVTGDGANTYDLTIP